MNMRLKSGFSLMEMMVVLLIAAIVTAASAPMISKNMQDGTTASNGINNCGWLWLGEKQGSVFNQKGNKDIVAMIGETLAANTATKPLLYIKSKDGRPQIELSTNQGKAYLTRSKEFAYWFSSKIPNDTDNNTSVAIGHESESGIASVSLGLSSKGLAGSSIAIGNNANATGEKSIAIGTPAKAYSKNSIAIGESSTNYDNAIAIGTATVNGESIAIGKNVNAASNRSVVIGSDIAEFSADYYNVVAIGNKPIISGTESVAIGGLTGSGELLEAGQGSVAIGANANAKGSSNVVIGYEANYTNYNRKDGTVSAVAIGEGVDVNSYSTGVGPGTMATGTYSVALGWGAEASESYSVAIGTSGAYARSEGSVAINGQVNGDADSSVALGNGATVYKDAKKSIAIGNGAETHNTGAIAIGYDTDSGKNEKYQSYKETIAIGNKANATGNNAIAIGGYYNESYSSLERITKAEGETSIAIGKGATTSNGGWGIAMGTEAKSKATSSIALGYYAEASGIGAIAIGGGNNGYLVSPSGDNNTTRATYDYSTAIGVGAKAKNSKSTAIGYNAETTAQNQIVLGTANDTVYIPGNLVVDGDVVLARNRGSKSYIRIFTHDDDDNALYSPKVAGNLPAANDNIRAYNSAKKVANGIPNNNNKLGIIDSDRRLKNVGEAFKGGLEEIKKLEVFNYVYKKDTEKTPRVGVMAQDLQKIFPNAVTKGDDGFLRIRMEDMFYALVNAVKELDKKIDLLIEKQKKIDELEKRVDTLEKRLAKLEKQMK